MSRPPQPAPIASTVDPCPTIIQISRTPRHWKFTQHRKKKRCVNDKSGYKFFITTGLIKMIEIKHSIPMILMIGPRPVKRSSMHIELLFTDLGPIINIINAYLKTHTYNNILCKTDLSVIKQTSLSCFV